MKIRNYIILITLGLFAACTGYEPEVSVGPGEELNALEVLNGNNYSILVDAINKSGIDLGTSPVTIFAPNNAAFQKLFTDLGVSGIADIDASVLADVLQYHVIAGELLAADLGEPATTLGGGTLRFTITEDDVIINGKALVTDANRVSTNGVIHGINVVLNRPAGTVLDVLAADGNYTTLVAAIGASNLTSAVTAAGADLTIFAPSDAAFAGYGLDATNIVGFPPEVLDEILSFHVLSGITFSQELPESGRFETLLGSEADGFESLIYNDGEFKTYRGSGAGSTPSAIEKLNILGSNGIAHGVDDLLQPIGTIFDFLNPASDSPRTGGDNTSPNQIDNLGSIVEGLNYEPLLDLSNLSTVFVPVGAPNYTDFASDADALAFLERHVFEGEFNPATLGNGDKITSVGGDEYYISKDADGNVYVNGSSTNQFAGNLIYDMYNGNALRYSSVLTPLPDDGIVDVLNAGGYTLMAATLVATEKDQTLDAGGNTFYTVSNAVFTAYTGITTVAQIEALDPTDSDDADLIAALADVIDIHTVSGADFSPYIATVLPTQVNVAGDDLFWAASADGIVIVLDNKEPNDGFVGIVDVDILYSNGVIHEVDNVIEF